MTLGETVVFEHVTRDEFIFIFPTVCEWCVQVKDVGRIHRGSNKFSVTCVKSYMCHQRSDVYYFLSQMKHV